MLKLFRRAICALMPLVATCASATVITFTGATIGSTPATYTESGYTLALSTMYGSSPAAIGGAVADPYLYLPGFNVISITGGNFTLGTFSAGNLTLDNGVSSVQVTGYLAGTQTFSKTIETLQSLVGLRDAGSGSQIFDRLVITSQTFSLRGAAIDNITLNAVGQVPEVSAWAMMIIGLGAVGATMRRRKTAFRYA